VALATVVVIGVFAGAGPVSAQATPTVTLTPSSGFHDQQVIEVSVGPNTLFPPNQSVKILECAMGATSDAQCDGNTQNVDTVVSGANGGFDYKSYAIFALPSKTLGEPADNKPVCDATHECQLYVGLNQTDFTQPKLFSAPFVIAGSTSPTSSTTATAAGATTSTTAGGALSKTGNNARRLLAIALGLVGVGLLFLAARWLRGRRHGGHLEGAG
jgi:hypothetical protein